MFPRPVPSHLLRERLGIEPPYILSVTRLAGYGNLLNLAKAYVSLVKAGKVTMPLVVPGEVWDAQYIGKVRKLLTDEGCSDRVKFHRLCSPSAHALAVRPRHLFCFPFSAGGVRHGVD